MCGNQSPISGSLWSLPPDIHDLVKSPPTLNQDQSKRPRTECTGIWLPRLGYIRHFSIHHLLLHHSFWGKPAAISSRHSNSPMEKPICKVTEASQQKTCEDAILKVDPPASVKPILSDDGRWCQMMAALSDIWLQPHKDLESKPPN